MADNILTTDRNSANIDIAAKEISSVKFPRNIIVDSAGLDIDPASEATLAALNAKVPASPAQDRVTAGGPSAVRLSDGSGFYDARQVRALTSSDVVSISGTVPVSFTQTGVTDTQLRASAVPVSISGAVPVTFTQTGLTDAQLRASAVPVSFTQIGLTDAQLRASAVPVSIGGTVPVTFTQTGLTDTQLRATAVSVAVSNFPSNQAVTGTFWQATQPVSFSWAGLTDAQLRATAVPVSGTFFQVTQPVSASALPLPSGAATETTLASIDTKTPTAGQKAMSASLPVVLASDQSAVTTRTVDATASGNITTQNLVPAGVATAGSAVEIAISGHATLSIQVTGTYTGALSLQGTVNGTTWVTVGGVPLQNVNTGAASATIASATQGIFLADVSAYSSVRVSGLAAMTGTATVSLRASTTAALVALDAPLPTGANTIGAVTLASTTVTSISAGTNAIGDIGLQYRASATGAASATHVVSAATTNATVVKASAGRVVGWDFSNTTASWRYVKLHNQTTTPTAGASVARTIGIPPGGKAQLSIPGGIGFATGIGLTIVTGSADSDATATAVGDVIGELMWA
jgi:hypothetical protein